MRCALLPGSYDPITIGHLDVIRRAAALFDKVTVLIAHNPSKNPLLCPEKRRSLAEDAVKDLPNAAVECFDGMLIDYIAAHDKPVLVKGIRNEKDFSYENEMAQYNRELCIRKYGFEAETLFLPSLPNYCAVSSTLVRTLIASGGKYDDLVPNAALLSEFLKF